MPRFQWQGGGAAPTYGHRVGWGPLSVLGTPSSWERYPQRGKGGGFSPGAIAVMSIEVGEERNCLFFSGRTELADNNFSTAVTDLR